MITIPNKGDVLPIEIARHNPELPWEHKSSFCGAGNWCRCKYNERVTHEFTVEQIIYFADNSIEAHGHLEDGTRYSEMLVWPHGDAC